MPAHSMPAHPLRVGPFPSYLRIIENLMTSESLRLAEHSWDDAEAFVDRMESLCHQGVAAEHFYRELVEGLAQATQSVAVALWQFDGQQAMLLARHGIEPGEVENASIVLTDRWSPQAFWPTGRVMLSSQRVSGRISAEGNRSQHESDPSTLVLRTEFDAPADSSAKETTQDVCAAVLGIASLVWLRKKHHEMRGRVSEQNTRDEVLATMHRGSTLSESLTNIAVVVADQTGVDRVSIFEVQRGVSRMAASSVACRIDRRSRHVRSMQGIVNAVIRSGAPFSLTVGHGEEVGATLDEPLRHYIDESGCRQLHVEHVSATDSNAPPVAAIVLERFRLPESPEGRARDLGSEYDSLRWAAADATREALSRDRHAWHRIVSRLTRGSAIRHSAVSALIAAAMIGVLFFVSVEFRIPAEGRLVANQSASLFAPQDATVESIHVTSGQSVKEGETLMLLRSRPLELHEKTLAGELATYQSRLAAVRASRSYSSEVDAPGDPSTLGDRRVLETMIASLQQRLALVHRQQAMLAIKSPIDGIVQRSDLQESLVNRPVERGHRLISVFAPDSGWTVDLDIPDGDIGYLIEANRSSPATCRLRLRSDPSRVFLGQVRHIENTSHLTTGGRSVVRANVHLPDDRSGRPIDSFRVGATVLASLHCGRRPAAFVWFRSVIEWARQQPWR